MAAKRGSYHHGDLRRALLDAALRLAVEGGSANVTLREAARLAGVSHNAPYRHFADKEAMLAAIAEEGFVELAGALRAARADNADAEERFVQTGLAYLRFAHARPGHIAVMFGPTIAKGQTAELQRLANETFQLLKEVAADSGVTDVAESRRVGAVVWSFLHGLSTLAAQRQLPASVGANAEDLAILGLRALFCAAEMKRGRRDRVAGALSARKTRKKV